MSEQNKISMNYLHRVVLQESENDVIQEIDSNLYNSISEFLQDLKNEKLDGNRGKNQSNYDRYDN